MDVHNHRTLRRNVLALLTDSGGFGGALGFIGYTTVLPSLVVLLTNSEPLVGLIGTLWMGAWLLPQLPAGRWLGGRAHKKPALLGSAAAARVMILIPAIALTLNLDRWLTFWLLLVAVIVFRGADAVSAVAWFDIVSKVLPPRIRGRVMGWLQANSFVIQFGASLVVMWALSDAAPGFPHNYALLLFMAAALLLMSFGALTFLVEPPGALSDGAAARLNLGAHARHVLKSSRAFRQLSLARIAVGSIGLAIPFYSVQAIKVLGLPENLLGVFQAAQTVGGVVAALLLGPMSERRGARAVIRVTMGLALIPPVLGLLLNAAGPQAPAQALGHVLLFAAIGATDGTFLVGFLQYVMEIAPPAELTAYTGLSNTIGGITVLSSVIGGVVLSATSYPVLFVCAAVGPLVGLWVAARMPAGGMKDGGTQG